jgi:hypothetical protein
LPQVIKAELWCFLRRFCSGCIATERPSGPKLFYKLIAASRDSNARQIAKTCY